MGGIKKPEGERRKDIMDAAAKVALDGGIESVTSRSVAAEAGLSIGLVYFYYESKEGLLHALLTHLLETILGGPPPGFGEDLSPRAALISMVAQQIHALPARRGEVDLIFQFYFLRHHDEYRAPINAALDRYAATLEPVTERLVEGTGMSGPALRSTLASLIYGAAVNVARQPEEFSPELLLQVVSTLVPEHRGH
ncbi:MAG: TetR/AcrR family transcriptional regulator [Micrococcaceae bacterium]|uniref:TetR/AcrR family transcriptional regulator n=1 Tax=unclassified Arthrobacter TaxID=235627 RepID=UPI00264E0E1A|nr:TetR/AcrR family transcriptional regulator [Micrococcaceae bacterium]MDN5824481.1 TetR/AcrR family transcriptional regulator [Micrococcaceae bacterium]MDN5878420.1 TetR/AcrR family transcriptional regulator [Micrococcaceae bacterium]MDN5887604.1 TetR/AcrR family transcriptional regulator [Micrococcaceae bacterium]MDN5906172.1 TetR/AcrR family transcriptional regulator [Micrococcaceae bacterium]